MAPSSPRAERSGFLPERIVHVHPTRLCNLACSHCYSASGPQHKMGLNIRLLRFALPLLKAEGYNLVSLSGGEPMTYPDLVPLIDEAHALGFRVTMVSNGMFSARRVEEVAARLDGIAISFDGLAASHNAIRGRSDAFEWASETVARLANHDIPVAAAISLMRSAIPELPELAAHLVGLGAKALQVRPVALAGRAQALTDSHIFTTADQARLYLVTLALQKELGGDVKMHCDLAPALGLWQQRDAYGGLLASCPMEGRAKTPRLLSDLVNPLVLTETGTLKPIAYDFNSRFDVASVAAFSAEELASYKFHRVEGFRKLIGTALAQLPKMGGLVDWFDYCARLSDAYNSPRTPLRHAFQPKKRRVRHDDPRSN